MILVSDLHFGSCTAAAKEALISAALADSDRLVVVSGDLTLNSLDEEFEEAKDFIEALLDSKITVVSTLAYYFDVQ